MKCTDSNNLGFSRVCPDLPGVVVLSRPAGPAGEEDGGGHPDKVCSFASQVSKEKVSLLFLSFSVEMFSSFTLLTKAWMHKALNYYQGHPRQYALIFIQATHGNIHWQGRRRPQFSPMNFPSSFLFIMDRLC